MICKKCGAQVRQNQKFCGICGTAVNSERADDSYDEVRTVTLEPSEEKNQLLQTFQPGLLNAQQQKNTASNDAVNIQKNSPISQQNPLGQFSHIKNEAKTNPEERRNSENTVAIIAISLTVVAVLILVGLFLIFYEPSSGNSSIKSDNADSETVNVAKSYVQALLNEDSSEMLDHYCTFLRESPEIKDDVYRDCQEWQDFFEKCEETTDCSVRFKTAGAGKVTFDEAKDDYDGEFDEIKTLVGTQKEIRYVDVCLEIVSKSDDYRVLDSKSFIIYFAKESDGWGVLWHN